VGDPPDPEMVVTRNTCQARNQPADGEPSAQPQVEPPMQLPTGPLIDMEAFVQVLSRLVAPRSTEPPILPELEELSRGAGTIERLLNQKKAVPPATTSTKSLPRCRYCPGIHFHANCPKLRRNPGNDQGATTAAEPSRRTVGPVENQQ
jgi:hypothetical protein